MHTPVIHFLLTEEPIRQDAFIDALRSPQYGAYVAFEGWVRDHNQGRSVKGITYEAYTALAVSEGTALLQEMTTRHKCGAAYCIHRVGHVGIGEPAVWVGVSAEHRKEAFAACMDIMDALKERVPIWKHEHYVDGTDDWLG